MKALFKRTEKKGTRKVGGSNAFSAELCPSSPSQITPWQSFQPTLPHLDTLVRKETKLNGYNRLHINTLLLLGSRCITIDVGRML